MLEITKSKFNKEAVILNSKIYVLNFHEFIAPFTCCSWQIGGHFRNVRIMCDCRDIGHQTNFEPL